jgi:hypothetical protein
VSGKNSQSTIDATQWVVPHLKTWHQTENTVHWWCSGVSSHPAYCSLVVLWSFITPHLLFLCGAVKSHHTVPSVPWRCYGISKVFCQSNKEWETQIYKTHWLWKYGKNNS